MTTKQIGDDVNGELKSGPAHIVGRNDFFPTIMAPPMEHGDVPRWISFYSEAIFHWTHDYGRKVRCFSWGIWHQAPTVSDRRWCFFRSGVRFGRTFGGRETSSHPHTMPGGHGALGCTTHAQIHWSQSSLDPFKRYFLSFLSVLQSSVFSSNKSLFEIFLRPCKQLSDGMHHIIPQKKHK